MQLSNIAARIYTAFANTGTKNTIPVASQIGITAGAASYTDGFPPLTLTPVASGGVPPYGADFNGILNAITTIQKWQSGGGLFQYDATWSSTNGGYPQGAWLLKATGTGFWVNLVDNNTTNPDSSGANWVDAGIQLSAGQIAVAAGTADALTATFGSSPITLTNGLSFIVRANLANATTTPSFAPNGLTAKTIVKGNGLALAAGDIAGAGHWLELQYDLTLDKWVLQNPATGIASSTATVQGAFKNLQASATGLSASVTVTADEIVLESASNGYTTQRAVSLTIAGTSSGVANGLDTGALAASTWYSVWVIWNGTTQAGLLSLSATAPTMPSGYTHKARVGWVRTDGTANKYPLGFKQYGRRVQYLVAAGSNLTSSPILISGVQGAVSTPTWVSAAWVAFAPTTAASLKLSLTCASSGLQAMAAPNASYGAIGSTSNPPPLSAGNASSAVTYANAIADIAPESENVSYASNAAGGTLALVGWEDNI